MKKKTKVILNLATITSISALIVGTSLGCAYYHDSAQQTALTQTKKDDATAAISSNLASKNINNGINYNDNAYLQTINQSGTVNPFSGAWTKTTALNYTVKNINDMVASFGVRYILRWVLIQNLNYNIIQYLQTINDNVFNIAVENFDYSILNVTNNNNLSKFSCTIKFSIQFKATCNLDNSSITFSNDYTYNNVKLQPMVMSIGNDGYSYLQLVNGTNNTFTPSQVNYCQNASISNGWSNKDFQYLLSLNWLPVTSSTSITTSNYQTALPANCMRSFTHNTSQSTIGQTTFVNFVSQYQLYTFNIGFKFDGLSKLVVECDNQYNSNNKYEVSVNQLVTLSINTILGTINPSINHSVKIEWQKQVTKNSQTTWSDLQTSNTYSFNALNNGVYRAIATFPNGKQTISNTVTINVQNNSLLIASKANSYGYGDSCTLYISDNQWAKLVGITYQWMQYDSSTGNWVDATGVNNSTTYTFNVYQSGTYELIINDGSGFSITSNSLAISVANNSVTITAKPTNASSTSTINPNSASVDYASDVTLSVGTTKWANNPDYIYTWTFTTADSQTSQAVIGKSTYTFSVTNDVLCQLVITSKTNKNFKLTSNIVSVNVNNNSIILGISGLSANAANEYSLNYGKMAAISIDNSYWNTPSLEKTWTYQWEGYGLTKDGKYEWQTISNPTNTNSLTLDSVAGIYSMYQLVLINKSNGLKLTSANVITINLSNQNAAIAASWSNQNSNGASVITIEQGSNVTLSVATGSYWAQSQFTTSSSYEYEWYDATNNTLIGHGSTFSANKITKDSSYYLVILSTTNKDFLVKSNTISIDVNVAYPLIESEASDANIGYGQQITLKLQPGNNDFWYSSGITYNWCTVNNGVITPLIDGASNYYQVVTNPTYTPFITQKSVEYCLQATIGTKKYYSNIIYVGYSHASDSVSITLNGNANANQNPTYYPSTYSPASSHILSIADNNYWTRPSVTSNVKVIYQWYSYQKNAITGAQENLTKLNSINNIPYEASFSQVNNGTTYYELEITQQAQVQTPSGLQTVTIGTPITNTITVTAASSPIQYKVDAAYGNVSNVTTSVYQCYYGAWLQLSLASTQNPNQQIVYNGCLYQWEVFNGENWIPVQSGQNIDGSASGTITSQNFAQFSFWITAYTQYRLHIYLNNSSYNPSNPNSSEYSYSIYSSPITFKVAQETININATNLASTKTDSSETTNPNQYQFTYGSHIKLSINNGWTSAYSNNEYVQYVWQTWDNDNEEWVNYDSTTQSFPSNNTTIPSVQGTNNCSFYFTQSGQYRLWVRYWNKDAINNNHPYVNYNLYSNIINLQVDHGNVYIACNASQTGSQQKNHSDEYEAQYNSTVDFSIENNDNETNYYVQNRTQYVFTWSITSQGNTITKQFSPLTNTSQYAPSDINILGYTTVSLKITLNPKDADYYQAFNLPADNSTYITCENDSISVQYTNTSNNSKPTTNSTCNYADSLSFNIDNADYWYGKTGYQFYWCAVQPDGTWIVLDSGATTTNGANYVFYATPFDGSDVINYQLIVVQSAAQAFNEESITINSKSYEHITYINNVFALRSNVLTVTVANANCNISYQNKTTNSSSVNTSNNALSQTINYGSSFTLSFDSSYWKNYQQTPTYPKDPVTGTLSQYQWQENDGSGWTNINGATSDTFTTSAINNKVQYRLALTWNWNSNNTSVFTVYSYPVTINVQNASVTINAFNKTNNQPVTNGQTVSFGSQLNLTINQTYWQSASTVKSYAWTQSIGKETSSTNSFSPYVLGQEGQVITYTLQITLTNGSVLSASISIKVSDATCTITPTTSSNNSLVLNNNTYTINYGSLCSIKVSGFWSSAFNDQDAGYTFTLSYNGTNLPSYEFLAQTGSYQLTITNTNWGSYSISSNVININTENTTFNLTAIANNKGSTISLINGAYSANYGTSINIKIGSGFNPGSLPTGYSTTKSSYKWYYNYSYENSTTNSIQYGSELISNASNDNLNIYLLSASSYNLIETYEVTNSSGDVIGSIVVKATSYINLSPTNIGICSISCTNYQINSQGVYVAPYLSSPKLQLSGWLDSDSNLTNNSSISYSWQNYTTSQTTSISATSTKPAPTSYTIDALTSQSQYGLTVSIPSITQKIYNGTNWTTKTFSAISNVLTFKIYATTINISPQTSSNITDSNNGTYTLDIGSSATLQLTSNNDSNAYWQGITSGVTWTWYDLGGQLGKNNPLTDVNGNSVSNVTYDNESLSLPANVNFITRTYYVVMTYTKNGKHYDITSNEITLVVNSQPSLTTTINGAQETITNKQNIQSLFGDQQSISFDYSSTFGASQSDWDPQIYVDGVNVTATSTNANTKFNIDGTSYAPIAITMSGTTYSFKTYPTPVKQILSYQVIINDSSKNPNPCYPLKSVTFNVSSIVPNLTAVANQEGATAGYNGQSYYAQLTGDAYPLGFPLSLVGNISSSNSNTNLNLPSTVSYQWYKFINGVPTAIPNITPTSNWPITAVIAGYDLGGGPSNFTPSAASNTSTYNFYVMDGMNGEYEYGITNNGITAFSNTITVKLLNSNQYLPSILNFDASEDGYSNSDYPVGQSVDIEYNFTLTPAQSYYQFLGYSTNNNGYFGSFTLQSSPNGKDYTTCTSSLVPVGQTEYYRVKFFYPTIKQINPFDTSHEIITFPVQYSNVVTVTSQSINNTLQVYNASANPSYMIGTSDLTKILPGSSIGFCFPTQTWWYGTIDDAANGDGMSNIIALDQKINGVWTEIAYVDENSYDNGSSSTMYPTYQYHDLWSSYKDKLLNFADNLSTGLQGFSGPTINNFGTYYYRLQYIVGNYYEGNSNPSSFEVIATTSTVTVTPTSSTDAQTDFLAFFSTYMAYYDKNIDKYGYTNSLGGSFNGLTSGDSGFMYYNDGSLQLPWIDEVGAGSLFALTTTGYQDWVSWETTGIEVENSEGKVIASSNFDFTPTDFTMKETGAICQDELNAQNNLFNTVASGIFFYGPSDNFLNFTNLYCLNSTNTNDYTGSLKIMCIMKAGDSILTSVPFIISFQKLQANQTDWNIQTNQNITSTGNNTYNVNANTAVNWNCLFPNENSSINSSIFTNANGYSEMFPILSSALSTTGNYTFDIQYYDTQSKQWISYFNPWTKNASFLTFGPSAVDYYVPYNPNYPTSPTNVNNSVINVPYYYLNPNGATSQRLLDNLAYANWSSYYNSNSSSTNWAPTQTLTFPSLSTWSVNPFSLNIARSGKYRIAMVFSLYNYVTPTASQIQSQNLEVYSPTYTFNVNQTTNIQLSSKTDTNVSPTSQNGLTFYNLNKNDAYTLSYQSSMIDWNGDGEYSQSTLESEYSNDNEKITFIPDTVTKDQYAMLWAGPAVILQYSWIYYPLTGGNPTTLASWTNSIKGYDSSANTNSAMFNNLYLNASSGQILGLASGSTTQYQPGTGSNPQDVLNNANVTLSGSTLKAGIYELEMEVLYTSFVGIMVNSYNEAATTNTPYNWNVFGSNPDDIYTTVTSNPIIILPFTTSNNTNN